jgi:hypothetical protein
MLEIRTAQEILDGELERQVGRRRRRMEPVMQAVYRLFVDQDGPVPVAEVAARLPALAPGAVAAALEALDAEDLLLIRDGRIEVAYPFMAGPGPFVVRLAGGATRHACCAIDALGLAPMLGQPVEVSAPCRHCGDPLAFGAMPGGPGPEGEGLMVWVGPRGEGAGRLATGL